MRISAQSLFGAAQPAAQAAPVVVTIGAPADITQLQANIKSIQSQLTAVPYGDSPLLKFNKNSSSPTENQTPLSAQRQMRFMAAKKTTPSNGIESEQSSFLSNNIPKVMSDMSPLSQNVASPDPKELKYKSKVAPPTLGRGLGANNTLNNFTNSPSLNGTIVNRTVDSAIEASLHKESNSLGSLRQRKSNLKHLDMSVMAEMSRLGSNATNSPALTDPDALPALPAALPPTEKNTVLSPEDDPHLGQPVRKNRIQDPPPPLNLDTTADESACEVRTENQNAVVVHDVAEERLDVRIKQSDYYSIPSTAELSKMAIDGKIKVTDGLTIGRASYGSVFWPGNVEIRTGIVLDELVVFRRREVTVYPNEEEKPAEGEELNRPAEVTLERIWYTDRASKQEIRDAVRLAEVGWRERLERQTIRMGANFKDYRPESGSWVFRVDHFSKYGLPDEDDVENLVPKKENRGAPNILDVQNQVQRTPISYSDKAKEVFSDVAHLKPVSNDAILNLRPPIRQIGLGGGLLQVAEQMEYSSFEEQSDDDFVSKIPEKKIKLELLAQLELETSRMVKSNFLDEQVVAKCVNPTRCFEGGFLESKMAGFKVSQLIDSGCVRGRSARVGWSAAGTLVCSEQPTSNAVLFMSVDRSAEVSIETMTAMVEANMALSVSTRNASGTALVSYDGNYANLLDSYVKISQKNGYEDLVSIWTLCQALFPVKRNDGWEYLRGEEVGAWLRDQAQRHFEIDIPTEEGSDVWKALCLGDRDEACRLAATQGMVVLPASLFALDISPEDTKQCFRRQIDLWERNDVLHTFSASVLKCYLVLAGFSHKKWKHSGREYTVNCLEGLHWIQALGIHIWYLRGWNGIEEPFEGYMGDVKAGLAVSHNDDLYGELITLACNPQYSVEAAIDAATSSFPHDTFLKWHLWSVFVLHTAYSGQLEASCLSQLAVFVLSHISKDNCRETMIRDLLDRIALHTSEDEFRRISSDCDVTEALTSAAKFVAAQNNGNSGLAFECAVEANNFEEAHRLFVEDVAPNAVITGDLETLRVSSDLIEPFSASIPGWGAYGQIFCDYSNLRNLDDQATDALCSLIEARLRAPNFTKTIQRISIQTIGRELFEFKKAQTGTKDWTMILGPQNARKALRNMTPLSYAHCPLSFS
ncbi:unnamed protein product [Caenorhabditis auriculariae]|uniref:Nuclear pore complex protein Nup98-Nup96 n=1 Tax=Caenorhabditis auriculariae TaxID=2777116 RepID=A0A8S1GX40_9PELO|nr:unnamed protein product [Caenorhabditis auriculariae]